MVNRQISLDQGIHLVTAGPEALSVGGGGWRGRGGGGFRNRGVIPLTGR